MTTLFCNARRIAVFLVFTLAVMAMPRVAVQPAQAAGPLTDISVAISDLSIFNDLPIELADSLGYFKDEGLRIHFLSFKSGDLAAQAVMAGQVQFGYNGIDQVINLRAAKRDVKIFATAEVGWGEQLVVAPSITSVEQLKGKTLGVGGLGASGTHLLLLAVLHKYGLDGAANVVPVGLGQTFVAAMESHRIDGGVAPEPWTTYIVNHGYGHVLVDADSLTGTRAVYGGPYAFNSMWASSAFIDSNQPLIEKIVRAVARADQYILKTPFDELKSQVPKVMTGDDPATALQGLRAMITSFAPTPVVSVSEVKRALSYDVLTVKKIADAVHDGSLNPTDVIDMRAADKVAKEMKLPASPE